MLLDYKLQTDWLLITYYKNHSKCRASYMLLYKKLQTDWLLIT